MSPALLLAFVLLGAPIEPIFGRVASRVQELDMTDPWRAGAVLERAAASKLPLDRMDAWTGASAGPGVQTVDDDVDGSDPWMP